MTEDEESQKLRNIFLHHIFKHADKVKKDQTKFVHYTTAEAAIGILSNKEVWMRKSSAMNDYQELQHGFRCLISTYKSSAAGSKFKSALTSINSNLCNEVTARFDNWLPYFLNDTYLTCFSKHMPEENHIGRLSMWRSYGAGGVAFVMNYQPFLNRSDALKAYTYPVEYFDSIQFENLFEEIATKIIDNLDFLKKHPPDTIKPLVFHLFRTSITCIKHPGFKEEQEWRIVHTPSFETSERLNKSIKVIRGIPQPIYAIPLIDVPDEGLCGIEIPKLIDRVIIGPTQYPNVIYEAIVELLSKAGMTDAAQRVYISNIPLRT